MCLARIPSMAIIDILSREVGISDLSPGRAEQPLVHRHPGRSHRRARVHVVADGAGGDPDVPLPQVGVGGMFRVLSDARERRARLHCVYGRRRHVAAEPAAGRREGQAAVQGEPFARRCVRCGADGSIPALGSRRSAQGRAQVPRRAARQPPRREPATSVPWSDVRGGNVDGDLVRELAYGADIACRCPLACRPVSKSSEALYHPYTRMLHCCIKVYCLYCPRLSGLPSTAHTTTASRGPAARRTASSPRACWSPSSPRTSGAPSRSRLSGRVSSP